MGKRQKKITKVDSLENSEEEETQILGEEEDAQPDRNGRKQFTNFAK